MEITNLTYINFVNQFEAFDDLTGLDFIMDLNDNHDKILKVVTAFSKIIEPTKKIKEFNQKGVELYKEFAEKNDKGNPKAIQVGEGQQQQTQYILEEATKAEFTKKYEALTKEFKTAIDAQETNRRDYSDCLNDKAKDPKIKKISRADVPKKANSRQLKLLFSVGMLK